MDGELGVDNEWYWESGEAFLSMTVPDNGGGTKKCLVFKRSGNDHFKAENCNRDEKVVCERQILPASTTDKLSTVLTTSNQLTTQADVETTAGLTQPLSTEEILPATTDKQSTVPTTSSDQHTTQPTRTTEPLSTADDSTTGTTAGGSCDREPCQNEGTCVLLSDGSFQCQCPFGYEGAHCESQLYPDANYLTLDLVSPIELFSSTPPIENPRKNPFYQLAAYYGTLETKEFNPHPSPSSGQKVQGRGSIGIYYRLTGAQSWLDPMYGPPGGTCVEEGLAGCSRGFAVSLWVLLEPGPADVGETVIFHAGTSLVNDSSPHLGIFIDAENHLAFQVNDGVDMWTVTIPARNVPFGVWCNLAFTWKPSIGLAAYINSHSMGTLDKVPLGSTPVPIIHQPWVVTIGGRGQKPSTSPMVVSDLVIWDRFLYDFERHRYLGVTAEELHVLQNADYLWTTDGYIRRDHTAIHTQLGIAATGNILSPSGLLRAPGRDGKGWAADVDGAADRWLALGDEFSGTCISDPSLCPDGITFALWARFRHPARTADDRSFGFIFSSGGQSSRGCALYQRGRDRLRATVADGHREWIVEVQFVYSEERWVHIAISWSQTSGLILYVDGTNRGRDRAGVARIRHQDLDGRLLVGRRNDYLGGYGNFSLEELAIWMHSVEPWQARKEFGLIENSYYATATHYWNQRRFISSTFGNLAKSASGTAVGPSIDVTVLYPDMVDLSVPGSYIGLGDCGSCISDPTGCSDGLTVSLWLRYQRGETSNTPTVIISSGGLQKHRGFAVYVKGGSLVVVVNTLDGQWFAQSRIQRLPNGVWANLAFKWGAVENLTLYINGIPFSGVVYNYTNVNTHANVRAQLILGESGTPSPSHPAIFHVHSLAIWERYFVGKTRRLLGMSRPEFRCYWYGDYCWLFEPALRLRHSFELSPEGAAFITDRNDQATAVCTDGRTGWISLGDFTGQCPADPSACRNGFNIAMWIKLKKITSHRKNGYLLSVGAEEYGETGVSLFQSVAGIHVKVVDDSFSWQTDIDSSWLTFDQWSYLDIHWSGQLLTVSIDGKELPTVTHITTSLAGGADTHYRDDPSVLTLGKSIHDDRGFISACYDDVLLRLREPLLEPPLPMNLSGPVEETENLGGSGPETAKEACKIVHEADCARTIEELLYVISDEIDLTDDAVSSSLNKLNHLSSLTLSSSELDAATNVISRIANSECPHSVNDTQAQIYLMDFLEVINNLLQPAHADDWISLQKRKAGTTSLMDSVETFASHLADNAHVSSTEVLLNKSDILLSLGIVPPDYSSTSNDLVIPRRSRESWRSIAEKWQNVDDNVVISKDLFKNTSSPIKATFLFTLYDSLQMTVPVFATNKFAKVEGRSLWVNSRILSVKVDPPFQGLLDDPVLITLTHQIPVTDSTRERSVCAFWNFDVPHTINGAWDREGCELQSTSQTQTVCRCNHLTHFAVIVEPQPDEELNVHAVVLRWLVRCLVALSVFLLMILVVTYLVSKRVHTLRHSIHLNHCLACLLASVIFALSELTSNDQMLCLATGASMHFSYLAVIMWSTMEACQLYRDTAVGGMGTSDALKGFAVWRDGMKYYMIGGWGLPAVVVGCVLAVSLHAYQPQAHDVCWLVETGAMPWAFSGPCCVALCVNIFVLIMVIRNTDSVIRKLDRTTGFRSGLRATILLTVLLAVTWVAGWKAIYGGPLWTSYVFISLNSLLGFFVFVLQGFGNVEVHALLCQDDPDLELALAKETPVLLQKPSDPEEKKYHVTPCPSRPPSSSC